MQDILAEIQERQWQAYCAAEHAQAVELFGPFVAWCIWPYKLPAQPPNGRNR